MFVHDTAIFTTLRKIVFHMLPLKSIAKYVSPTSRVVCFQLVLGFSAPVVVMAARNSASGFDIQLDASTMV